MYENQIITEPKWKSWIVQTTTPLFTPDQCKQIIECGKRLCVVIFSVSSPS